MNLNISNNRPTCAISNLNDTSKYRMAEAFSLIYETNVLWQDEGDKLLSFLAVTNNNFANNFAVTLLLMLNGRISCLQIRRTLDAYFSILFYRVSGNFFYILVVEFFIVDFQFQ